MQINQNVQDIFAKANMLRETLKSQEVEKEKPQENKEKIETPVGMYVGVTGIKIKENGTITKDHYLDKLSVDESAYRNLQLTEEEVKAVSYSLKRQSSGINSVVPMRCNGDSCPFKNNCPYFAIGKAPIGKACLPETQLIHYWTEQYIDEFNVNPSNITEVHMVSELAEFNVYEMRITKHLAENHPILLQDVVVGIDANGNVIENQEISRAFELKDRIKKNRMKVLEALMATRKEKLKLVSEVVGGNSTSAKMHDLKQKMEELARQIKGTKIIDAEIVG